MFKSIISNDKYGKDIMNVLMYMYGFKNIYNIPLNTYLSGSSVLKIIQKRKPEEFNDLDLYIQNGVTEYECQCFMDELRNAGYLKGKSNKIIKNIQKSLMNTQVNNDDSEHNITQEHAYFSLKEYIDKIVSLNSGSKSVDIIIINKPIEELLANTFDMDIVKNYVKVREDKLCVQVYNLEAIHEKKATISVTHFNNRIMHNAYEFNNFIKRYIKYSTQYEIYVGSCLLPKDKFKEMIEFIFEDIQKFSKRICYEEGDILSGIIAVVKIDDTVFRAGSFNERGTKLLFNHLIRLFDSAERINCLKTKLNNLLTTFAVSRCNIQ